MRIPLGERLAVGRSFGGDLGGDLLHILDETGHVNARSARTEMREKIHLGEKKRPPSALVGQAEDPTKTRDPHPGERHRRRGNTLLYVVAQALLLHDRRTSLFVGYFRPGFASGLIRRSAKCLAAPSKTLRTARVPDFFRRQSTKQPFRTHRISLQTEDARFGRRCLKITSQESKKHADRRRTHPFPPRFLRLLHSPIRTKEMGERRTRPRPMRWTARKTKRLPYKNLFVFGT